MRAIPQGRRVEFGQLSPDPDRILTEYDGPRFFVSHVENLGLDVLAFSCDEDEEAIRYIVVPTSQEILSGLDSGSITVFESLTRTTSRPWIIDVQRSSWSVRDAVSISRDDLPDRYLPKAHLMLRADLQPLLTLKMEGTQLLHGSTPRDAALHAFKSVPEGLKKLLDYLLERTKSLGRPTELVRAMYGFPAQRFAFGSFEVSYRRPDHGLFGPEGDSVIQELSILLNKSICEATGQPVEASDDERRVLLDAAYRLAPPSRGVVQVVRFSGSMIDSSTIRPVMNQRTRGRVRVAIQDIENPMRDSPFLEIEARVGDVDFDDLTIELRGVNHDILDKIKVHFEPDFVDDVAQPGRVRAVIERARDGKYHLLAIVRIYDDVIE